MIDFSHFSFEINSFICNIDDDFRNIIDDTFCPTIFVNKQNRRQMSGRLILICSLINNYYTSTSTGNTRGVFLVPKQISISNKQNQTS